MGLFSRFVNIVRANLTSVADQAEDPEKMLNQMLTDLEEQKKRAKEQLAHAIADQKLLENTWEKEKAEADRWEQNAILAVQKGDDELAKQALLRKKEHQARSLEYEQQVTQHTKNVDALKASFKQLDDKIEEIRRKKNLLLAKHRQAKAQEQIYQTLEGIDTQSSMATIERVEQKIETLQARGEAYQELTQTKGDSLEKRFAELRSESADVDAELLALKQRAHLPERT